MQSTNSGQWRGFGVPDSSVRRKLSPGLFASCPPSFCPRHQRVKCGAAQTNPGEWAGVQGLRLAAGGCSATATAGSGPSAPPTRHWAPGSMWPLPFGLCILGWGAPPRPWSLTRPREQQRSGHWALTERGMGEGTRVHLPSELLRLVWEWPCPRTGEWREACVRGSPREEDEAPGHQHGSSGLSTRLHREPWAVTMGLRWGPRDGDGEAQGRSCFSCGWFVRPPGGRGDVPFFPRRGGSFFPGTLGAAFRGRGRAESPSCTCCFCGAFSSK